MKNFVYILLTAFLFSCNPYRNINEKIVEISTTEGKIIVKLYNETPKHRDNFIKLVNDSYYNNILFHRVIENFMIQAGDPDSKNAAPGDTLGEGDPGYKIDAEFNPNIFHKKGVLAAAREGSKENPYLKSSGSQFYIVQGKKFTDEDLIKQENRINKAFKDNLFNKLLFENQEINTKNNLGKNDTLIFQETYIQLDSIMSKHIPYTIPSHQKEIYKTIGGTPHLDGSYTIFGEVLEGIEIVDKIAAEKTDSNDRPLRDIKIINMKLLN